MLEQAAIDMTLAHEAVPSGTVGLGFDWVERPRLSYGEHAPDGWSSTIAWGQIYEPTTGNPATNVRVQIRSLRLVVLSESTEQWVVLQDTSDFGGALFREDYADNDNVAAPQRDEAEGASVVLPNGSGRNYHFWSATGRSDYDLGDVDEVVALVDARLVLDDPAGPDDRDQARLMMSVGADYWLDNDAQWDNWTTNGDVGIGRFGFISSEWRTFTMTTLTPGEAAALVPEPSALAWLLAGLLAWSSRPR
ncbi:MAG: hypothetical protein AAFX76_10180 [Planctomycetota bacterium]